MKVIILSGISGAGKSTYIKKNHPNAIVCSADDFFMIDGEYRFDPTKLGQAHATCFRKYLNQLSFATGYSPHSEDIVVDNTNTTAMEISPYVLAAEAYGVEYEIVTLVVDPSIATKRNVHKVPEKTVFAMAKKLAGRILPPWWNHKTVTH